MCFLGLCKLKISSYGEPKASYAGVFSIENYPLSRFRKNEALLIEGIHQYSSLIAESVFGKRQDSVFVPVMIKNMDIHSSVNLEKIVLKGEIISSEEFIHVRIMQLLSGRVSGHADVFLKKILLPDFYIPDDIPDYGSDLFNVILIKKTNDGVLVNFKLNEFHHILKDHFRGYPVCPASLIIEFINDILCNYGLNKDFQIQLAKFISPIQPYNEYELDIKLSGKTVSFIITNSEKIRITAGHLIYK
ncbi:hypothetical protein [Morganella morganii]|uniref:hypothetical protein n=1 Tax=Morganella morganii TaxID=582 RepID=UPI002367BF0D|nr:hypothetical protein [Morganella morganii]